MLEGRTEKYWSQVETKKREHYFKYGPTTQKCIFFSDYSLQMDTNPAPPWRVKQLLRNNSKSRKFEKI